MKVVRRTGRELGDEMEVEVTSLAGLRMNQEAPTADAVSEAKQSRDDVHQEAGTEPATFMRLGDTQTREQRDGLRVPARTLAQTAGRRRDIELSHAPRVVRDDSMVAVFADDEDPGRAACRRLASVPLEPRRLLDGAAAKVLGDVLGAERLRRSVASTHEANGEGRANRRRKPGRSRGERRLIASHAVAAAGESTKWSRSARMRCAASARWVTTNVVTSVPAALAARSMRARSSVVARTSRRSLRRRVAAVLMSMS